MTAAEKKTVFKLIKLASDYTFGYNDNSISEHDYNFQDDVAVVIKSKENKPKSSDISMEDIAKKVKTCKNCRLSQARTNTVLGEGVAHPVVLVVGEGPGEQEDKSGRPFVGPAGQLLDKMLAAINLSRTSNCYIGNIVKCRPPKNRTPYPDEMETCVSYLEAQIHILKPKVILAMGNTAVKGLIKTEKGITHLHGTFLQYNGIPFLPTFHPSALLHNVELKRPAWEDLKILRSWLETNAPGYDKATS